jgi:UDP-glucose 4-epimerase
MKILVTGGAGFIGSHIVDAALSAGYEVSVLDDLSSGRRENLPEGVRLEVADLRSEQAAAFVEAERPDVVSHHAAQMNVRRSVEDPAFDADVNVLGLLNVVEAARRGGVGRVVFASSGGTVYGDPVNVPPAEDEPTGPLCPYGVSKLAGEIYLSYYAKVHELPVTILRYANVYGPRQDPHGEAGVVSIFARGILAGSACKIFGDGLQTRDYVFVQDVARANLMAIEKQYNGTLNIGTGLETDVVALYGLIRDLVGSSSNAEHVDAMAGEVRRSVLDCGKAIRELGWTPSVKLQEGLAETVKWFSARAAATPRSA